MSSLNSEVKTNDTKENKPTEEKKIIRTEIGDVDELIFPDEPRYISQR